MWATWFLTNLAGIAIIYICHIPPPCLNFQTLKIGRGNIKYKWKYFQITSYCPCKGLMCCVVKIYYTKPFAGEQEVLRKPYFSYQNLKYIKYSIAARSRLLLHLQVSHSWWFFFHCVSKLHLWACSYLDHLPWANLILVDSEDLRTAVAVIWKICWHEWFNL